MRANPFEKSSISVVSSPSSTRNRMPLWRIAGPRILPVCFFFDTAPLHRYECASALIALTSSPTAIRAAATSYTQLLSAQSDNNIKLIVLERLQASVLSALADAVPGGLPPPVCPRRLQQKGIPVPPRLRTKKQHPKVLQEMIMDIMRALGTGVGSNIKPAARIACI